MKVNKVNLRQRLYPRCHGGAQLSQEPVHVIYLYVIYLFYVGGKFEKNIQLLRENLKKTIVFKLKKKSEKSKKKIHKSQIEIINEGNMLTDQC